MLSAVEGQACDELAEQRVMVPVARSAPVTATTPSSGVLVCETVCAVLAQESCPHPVLHAQL